MTTTISQRVVTVISTTLGIPEHNVHPIHTLGDDLGADSLDVTELVLSLEDEFGIQIHDDAVAEVKTVADVIGLVETRIGVPLAA